MSAERLAPGRKITRREFLRESLLWSLGTGATLFLAGCEEAPTPKTQISTVTPKNELSLNPSPFPVLTVQKEEISQLLKEQEPKTAVVPKATEEIFPPRTKLSEIISWKEESPSSLKEIEKGTSLFGQFVHGSYSQQKIFISDLMDGQTREFSLPFKSPQEQFSLSLSPQEDKLAVCIPEEKSYAGTYRLFILDLSAGIFKELRRGRNTLSGKFGWSPDGQFLFFQGPYESLYVFDSSTKEILLEKDKETSAVGFSPDGQWFLTSSYNSKAEIDRIEAFNFKSRESLTVLETTSIIPEVKWFPNGSTFATLDNERGLVIFDLSSRQKKVLPYGKDAFQIAPDGKTIIFYEELVPIEGDVKIGVLDLETGQARSVLRTREMYPGFIFKEGFSVFSSSSEIIFTKEWMRKYSPDPVDYDIKLYKFNFKKGTLSPHVTLRVDNHMFFERLLNTNWLLLSSLYNNEELGFPRPDKKLEFIRKWYFYSLASGKSYQIGETKEKEVPLGFKPCFSATFLPDGNLIKSSLSGQKFYFTQGRKYPLAPNTAKLLGGMEKSVPQRTLEQIPESLNKLKFQGGDLLLEKNGSRWYLRDGKRSEVPNLERFQTNVQFNRQKYEIPPEISKRIPEGQDPAKELGKFLIKDKFLDWDGHFIEPHPEGSVLLLFVKGWHSQTWMELGFPKMKEFLGKYGWTEGRMAEFTYNAQKLPGDGLGLAPYSKDHTTVSPVSSCQYLEWQIERYKKMLPWTNIILIGHSLGGWLAFNAAWHQAEAVRAVITLDSPLKGVDKTKIGDKGEELLRQLWGDDVAQFLLISNETTRFVAERQSQFLIEHGVDVFTFASTDDIFVSHEVAFLENGSQGLAGSPLNLRFPMGRIPGLENPQEFIENWGELISAHGTVLRHPLVLEAISKIVGKVG